MDIDSFGNCTGVYSDAQGGESILYSYDTTQTVSDFLLTKTDPYFVIHNTSA